MISHLVFYQLGLIALVSLFLVVYLQPAGKYKRPAWRLSQGQKDIKVRAIMASQWPSHPW
jgi:hypothetical protein